MANLFAFALGIATARAEDRSSDDQIRRGVLMGFAPSPAVGAVLSRVIEDREETGPEPRTSLAAGTDTPSSAATTTTSSAVEDQLRQVKSDVDDIKKDVGNIKSTVETGFKEIKDLITKSGPSSSGASKSPP